MQPEIAPLDAAHEATVEAVQALRVAAGAADVPDFPPPCAYGFRGQLTHEVSSRRMERFVARSGGEVAGYLSMELPLLENLENADVELVVHPAHRRRGVGRILHEHLLERLRELGRKRYASMTVEALPGGPARGESGRHFATAVGAKSALDDVRRRLDLATVDEAALAGLRAGARARAAGYRVVTWRGRAPEEYVADVAYLHSRFVSDAPMGDLQWEPQAADTTRVREQDDINDACRRRSYSAGAVHEESGRLVGLTTIGRQHSTPWHAFQWITLVDPAHRGHRLGALVKVANLGQARENEPELRVIDTWNAAVNQHMIAINEAMGFRPVDCWVNWQQEI
jgi:GNAT superfamily N-acetyltransferase